MTNPRNTRAQLNEYFVRGYKKVMREEPHVTALRAKSEAVVPQKRRRVRCNPNSTILRIKHIHRTQIEASIIEDKEDSDESKS